ncbi:MAG: hypothetical protein K8L99_02350, partial [Anaerolineae bacterium]|nr:hypothetical protein [Anaerolineae bacterium]
MFQKEMLMQFMVVEIVKNEDGATYEGGVFTRFLTIRTSDGHLLSVFDPEVLSTDVEEGGVYDLLLL